MNYYNQISKGYAELHKEEQLNKLRIIKENLGLKGNEKILDIGCGPCWSTEFFDDVVGVDSAFGLLDSDKFVVNGKAEMLPFKDNSFDVILCVTAVHHFELEKAFEEMKRVAKKDAVYVVSVLKKAEGNGLIKMAFINHFKLYSIVEEDKDVIYFCKALKSP